MEVNRARLAADQAAHHDPGRRSQDTVELAELALGTKAGCERSAPRKAEPASQVCSTGATGRRSVLRFMGESAAVHGCFGHGGPISSKNTRLPYAFA